jgi:hypothetical protein
MTKRLGLLPSLVGLAVIAVTTPACAQAVYGDRGYGYGADARRVAYDNGYRRGIDNGERDARARRAANHRDDSAYRDGDWGYDRRFGSHGQYRQLFRDGYEVGYRDGYARYARGGGYGSYGGYGTPRNDRGYGYPGGYGYGDPARDYGYREGFEKGAEDARDGDRFDPLRHKWYREGDRHYNSRYGSRDRYMAAYRDAFRQGYEEGYRGRYR